MFAESPQEKYTITQTYFPETTPKGYRTDTEGISMSPLIPKKYFATLFMSSEVFP